MPAKKYWEEVLKSLEIQKENAEGAITQDEVLIELCKKKISEFKEEEKAKEDKDEAPEGIKDILKSN